MSQNFVKSGQHELLHGIELAARYFETNPREVEAAFDLKDKRAEKEFYTIENILTIFESLFPGNYTSLKQGLFKMLAFDAIVGAPDRHAMNWGVLAPLTLKSEPVRFSPILIQQGGYSENIQMLTCTSGWKYKARASFSRNMPNVLSPFSVREVRIRKTILS